MIAGEGNRELKNHELKNHELKNHELKNHGFPRMTRRITSGSN